MKFVGPGNQDSCSLDDSFLLFLTQGIFGFLRWVYLSCLKGSHCCLCPADPLFFLERWAPSLSFLIKLLFSQIPCPGIRHPLPSRSRQLYLQHFVGSNTTSWLALSLRVLASLFFIFLIVQGHWQVDSFNNHCPARSQRTFISSRHPNQ